MSKSTPANDFPSHTQLSDAMKDQRQSYDCTPCRLMGSATFVGLGAYTYHSGMKQLRQAEVQQQILKSGTRFGLGARKAAILAMSAGCAGLGMYRLVN